jgi:hypothetical protein
VERNVELLIIEHGVDLWTGKKLTAYLPIVHA